MAKSQLSFKRNITDKLNVKGILSEDCKTITYKNEQEEECEVAVHELLRSFMNQAIEFTVALKSDEELELPESNED